MWSLDIVFTEHVWRPLDSSVNRSVSMDGRVSQPDFLCNTSTYGLTH